MCLKKAHRHIEKFDHYPIFLISPKSIPKAPPCLCVKKNSPNARNLTSQKVKICISYTKKCISYLFYKFPHIINLSITNDCILVLELFSIQPKTRALINFLLSSVLNLLEHIRKIVNKKIQFLANKSK